MAGGDGFVELCMGLFVGRDSRCTRFWLGRMDQGLLKTSIFSFPLLCRWQHFRENGRDGRLRSKGGRPGSSVPWNDDHAHVDQGVDFESDAKCLKVVIYRIFLGPSQQVVDIVTIFKDDRRVTADLGKLDIKIVCESKFAANDAFDIIKRMF